LLPPSGKTKNSEGPRALESGGQKGRGAGVDRGRILMPSPAFGEDIRMELHKPTRPVILFSPSVCLGPGYSFFLELAAGTEPKKGLRSSAPINPEGAVGRATLEERSAPRGRSSATRGLGFPAAGRCRAAAERTGERSWGGERQPRRRTQKGLRSCSPINLEGAVGQVGVPQGAVRQPGPLL